MWHPSYLNRYRQLWDEIIKQGLIDIIKREGFKAEVAGPVGYVIFRDWLCEHPDICPMLIGLDTTLDSDIDCILSGNPGGK